jgi:hypothetical protein
MSETTARAIFSGLCLAAMVAIAVGGVLEIVRQKRGESLRSATELVSCKMRSASVLLP